MTARRSVVLAFGAAALAPLASFAQRKSDKVHRIGLLGVVSATGYARQIAALRQGLGEFGYVEGKNLVIEYRWAEGRYDRLPVLAAELVSLKPELIVTSGQGTRILKAATTTIPIIMAVGTDTAVESLARPGGNVTGSTAFTAELSAKRLEMLKDAVPNLAKVGVLLNADNTTYNVELGTFKQTAAMLKVGFVEAPVRSPGDFEDAFALMLRSRVDGVVAFGDSMLVANMRRLGEISYARRLAGAGSDEYADGGGLLAYGVNFPELWRRAAYFADRILKGDSPATLPVERASKFDLVVNLKTANALGLRVPQSLLARAERVIE